MQIYLGLNMETWRHSTFNKLVFFVSLLLLTACEAEESFEGNLVPAVFIPGFSGDLESDTRATNGTWTLNDKVGIYMLDGSDYTLFMALALNVEYCATSAGATTTLSPVDAANTLYYPLNGETVRFVAYAPYCYGTTSVSYTFTDQSTSAKKEAVDFIFYRGTTDRSRTNATETMAFKHKFCKININVKQGTNGLSCSDLTMTLTKMPQYATVSLSRLASSEANENAVSGLGISTSNTIITAWTSVSATASATVEAIVAPHTGSGNFAGRTFTFSAGGYIYNLPDDMTFEPGKVYDFDFTLTQTAAVLTNTTITNWTGGEVSWNGDYYLNAAQKELTLSSAANSSNKLVMLSNYPNNPEIAFLAGEDPDSEPIDWLSAPTLTKSTSGTEHTYTLTYTSADNTATLSTSRVGYIHITAGTVTTVVKVTQKGIVEPEANCYILQPGNTISIPVSRANAFAPDAIGASTVFYYQLLWQDNEEIISSIGVEGVGATGCLTITSNNGKEGNAIVAVTVGGEIKWSWHIWVTKFNPDAMVKPYTDTNGVTTVFMDRNLGALNGTNSLTPTMGTSESLGLHYQWGRKDPLPTTGIPLILGAASIAETVRNPFCVFSSYSSMGDWCNDSSDGLTRWGSNPYIKSLYDPCPAGWRVPNNVINSGFVCNSYGGYHEQLGWYPYSGWRLFNSFGSGGYYWSAMGTETLTTTSTVMILGGYAQNIDRTYGCAVRCIKED